MDLTWLLLGLFLLLLLGLVIVKYSAFPVRHVLRDLGIETPAYSKLFGHFFLGVKYGVFDVQTQYYSQFKDKKMYGWIDFRTPVVVLRDLDLIKDVCVKHFSSFADRRIYLNFEPPFDESLLCLLGDHWKRVRSSVSPTFSSGRLKKMSRHVERKVQSLQRVLDQKQERNEEIELRDVMSRFTMDTIASTAFGLDIDTLGDPENAFCVHAKQFINPNMTLVLLGIFCPPLARLLAKYGISFISSKTMKFFENAVDSALQVRKESGDAGKMHDFIDLMINAEKEQKEKGEENKMHGGLTRNEILGQALVFILAGYDTVAIVLSFTLFLLAKHPEYQKQVQEELDQKLSDLGPDDVVPTYDSVQGLNFLDQCISEAMRMFPPGLLLDRVCTEEINLAGVKFSKGMPVIIPVYGIHMDPELWEEPQEFRPERFEPEAKESRHQFAYLPFGHGPRNCIGMRLGQLELKIALAMVLRRFDVVPCEKTVYPVKLSKLQVMANDGLWVKLERRAVKS
ncbi:cytochrome p450-like protein [Plakobranchus ocellatus]|uniref:Cytochrome p450-like protein n=1 Tax=Plakobranchus ocellatus TaxID=259542 RepID=A0AAV4BVC9_9GAST|nr:cytochrome p450-like protein [Plakobranchus ocellatus]